MKKYIYALVFLTLTMSCSSDDSGSNSTSSMKPKKYTVTEVGESPYSLFFEYNDNLITKVTTDFGNTITINYDSQNRISNYTIDYTGEPSDTFTATYENGLLKQFVNNTNTEKTIFYYNSSNKVNKTEYYEFGDLLETTLYEYDLTGNVNQQSDDYSILQYTHDNANNPFKNVFPQMDAEVSWPWFGSLINNESVVKEKLGGSTTFTTKYTYTYEYNSSNYPTKRTQKNPSGQIRETVTYEYY